VALLAAFFEGDSVSGIVSVAMNAFVLFYEVFDSAFPKFCHYDRRRSFARERSSEWRNLLPSSAQNVPSLRDFDHLLAHPALTRWAIQMPPSSRADLRMIPSYCFPSVAISEKSAIVENSLSRLRSSASRLARNCSSSTITITLSKNASTAGRRREISARARE